MSVHRLVGAVAASAFLIVGGGSLLALFVVDDWALPGIEIDGAAPLTEKAEIAGKAPSPGAGRVEAEATEPIAVSLLPKVSVRNATPQQHRRLREALERFRSAGLLLPDLEVEFHADTGPCGGHFGVFRSGSTPWRIMICTTLDAVYEHELAHAWELANLDDEIRRRFMEYRGHELWNDPSVPGDERGVEGTAFVVQQGLVDLPLPPTLSAENRSRLVAFAILTGQPAPRLLEWVGLDSEDQNSLKCIGDAP